MVWRIIYASHAQKDALNLQKAGLKSRAEKLLECLQENPFQNPPPYEKLLGTLSGLYSRRINIQHRLVYDVDQKTHTVKVLRMWSHYERL